MCKLDVLKFYGYVVGDQIYQTPSPQHTAAPVAAPVAAAMGAAGGAAGGGAALAGGDHAADDVPVIVVALPQHNMSSFNNASAAINYHQRSPSSSQQHQHQQQQQHQYQQQQQQLLLQQQLQQQQLQQHVANPVALLAERGRRNSAPATMPQIICTASRQVTDV